MDGIMKKEKIFNRRSVFFSLMVFLMFSALVVIILRTQSKPPGVDRGSGWTPSMMREYASKLRSEGLIKPAISAYEEYLAKGGVDNQTRANIYYTIGTMLMEGKNYEDALAYFYKAEIAHPDSPLKKDIGANIVTALENMGKGLDAEYALEERTALSRQDVKKKPRGEIVAKIGKREIAMGEINDAIEKLPPWLGEQYKKDELKKLEFLQQYVFMELLYDKGRKLGYDKSPEIREIIEEATKQSVVTRVVEDEIKKRVKVDPSDIKLYYEANKDRYTEKEKLKFSHIQTDTREKAQDLLKRTKEDEDFTSLAKSDSQDALSKDKGGEVVSWIFKDGYVPGIGDDKKFIGKLFKLNIGEEPVILESEKGFHIVKLNEKLPERKKTFEEVKGQVEYEYRQGKERTASEELLQQMLKSKDVQIYSWKFKPKKEEEEAKEETGEEEQ